MKRQALDYLAFLTWWTISVTEWDFHVLQDVADAIADLQLDRHKRRGVLIELEWDWRQINILHLLYHRVPIYYRWTESLEANNRFLTLSPAILRTFQSKCEASVNGKVLAVDMPEFALPFEKIKDYNEFFQWHVFNSKLAEGLQFDADWSYTIVDFQGWLYRPISIPTMHEFVKHFGSHIVQRGGQTFVIFRRWEALTDETSIIRSTGAFNPCFDREVVRRSTEI